MSASQRCLLVIVGLIAFAFVACADVDKSAPTSQLPIVWLEIEVSAEARPSFLSGLKNIAERFGMKHRLAPVSPDNTYWSVEMVSADFRAIAVNGLNPGVFSLFIYESERVPLPTESVSPFLSAVRSMVDSTTGTKVTREGGTK